ncbi:MAG: class A beta-lactamase-related serine hydrolase [Flavobacteriales bacterium]|nr:MAG: class A beta-lactamase-related serine hydrolase [Flavobacteriales bacterium]
MKSLIILFFVLISTLAYGQVDSTDLIVHRMMNEQKIVGLSLAVIKNGETIVNKGFGLANAEHQVAVTPTTVIRLGSLSKQFFTTAIMKLQEQGKLSIEDYVHQFFPDAPETWRPIQLKHLMSHTSGLKREGPAYNNSIIQPDLVIIKSAYGLPLDFKTGEKYQYCNLGYYILAEIIKQVSGMPWQDYIKEQLFIPAGMNNSGMTDFYPIIANRANGYMHKNGLLVNADAMYAVRPSGGFLSTSSDMILWEKVLREKNKILKKENWEQLWKPYIKTSTDLKSKAYYGFGWIIDERNGNKTVEHGGANVGFRSYYTRFVDKDLTIIILTNTDGANPAAIVKALSNHYFSNK